MSKEKKWELIRYVCIGNRFHGDAKLHTVLLQVTGSTLSKDEKVYERLKLWCGGVYDIPTSAGTITVSAAVYIGRWENSEQTAAWDARSQAEGARYRLHKDGMREGKKGEALRNLLAPIRAEYYKLDSLGKKAMEIAVIDSLRSAYL